MLTLNSVDQAIVVAYLTLTLVVGLWLRRRATQSLEHYYLGGRRLPWPLLGVSGMTNWFDLTGTMIITSFLFLLGPRGLYVEFRGGAVLALAFMLLWTGKWFRRSGCMTSPEWYSFRFGPSTSARVLRGTSALFGIVLTIGMLAYLVRGTSLFLGFFLPSAPLAGTVAVILLATAYTMLSGFYGVVINDLIQGALIVVACLVVAFLAFNAVGSVDVLASVATRVTGNPEWLTSFPSVHTTMPPGYEAYQPLMMVTVIFLAKAMLDGASAGDDTRYFAARTDRECGLLSLLQGVTIAIRWPMMMGFAVLGLFLVNELLPQRAQTASAATAIKAHAPAVPASGWHEYTQRVSSFPEQHPALASELQASLGPRWREALPLVGFDGNVNPEQVLPAVMKYRLPTGVCGLVLVAMLAAMMSTLSGTVNGIGSAWFVRDIYQNFLRPGAHDRELILVSYAATGTIVALGFYLGLSAPSINNLWGWLMMGFLAGATAPKLLRLYWWRCNAWGCAIGIASGGAAAVVLRLGWPDLAEWRQFFITGGFGLAGVVIGSLCTPATPREVVSRFYRQTRPFGAWGPFWKELPRAEQLAWRREHRNDLLALPFTLLAQITLFLVPMQLVLHAYGDLWRTLPWFFVGAAGMYWFWWRPLAAHPQPAASPKKHAAPAVEPTPALVSEAQTK